MADVEWLEKPKFRLFLCNNDVFVWDKNTIITLREKYRIVGSLIGSLPSQPRQNLLFSVPLVLQAEEVTLLIEKNLATVVMSSCLPPSDDVVKCFQNEREDNIAEQIEKLKEIKKDKLEEFAEVIEQGRVKKRKKRPNYSKRKHSKSEEDQYKKLRYDEDDVTSSTHDQTDESHENTSSNEPSSNELKMENLTENTNTEQENRKDSTLVHVNTQQPSSLSTTVEAQWTFPENDQETQRYKVYCDLWEKGYYITKASKFGGDYLVYPGDPFRFHSYFVVTVTPWRKKITTLELVTVSRLGSSVKKTSVLASVNCLGNVIYTSIEWPGFT